MNNFLYIMGCVCVAFWSLGFYLNFKHPKKHTCMYCGYLTEHLDEHCPMKDGE